MRQREAAEITNPASRMRLAELRTIPMTARFFLRPLLQPITPTINPATNTITPRKTRFRSAMESRAPMIDSAIEAVDQSNPCRRAGTCGGTPDTIGGAFCVA